MDKSAGGVRGEGQSAEASGVPGAEEVELRLAVCNPPAESLAEVEEATLSYSSREDGCKGGGFRGLEVQDNSGGANVTGEGGGGGALAAVAGGGGEGSRALCCYLILELE